jgi:hypothetical protein
MVVVMKMNQPQRPLPDGGMGAMKNRKRNNQMSYENQRHLKAGRRI